MRSRIKHLFIVCLCILSFNAQTTAQSSKDLSLDKLIRETALIAKLNLSNKHADHNFEDLGELYSQDSSKQIQGDPSSHHIFTIKNPEGQDLSLKIDFKKTGSKDESDFVLLALSSPQEGLKTLSNISELSQNKKTQFIFTSQNEAQTAFAIIDNNENSKNSFRLKAKGLEGDVSLEIYLGSNSMTYQLTNETKEKAKQDNIETPVEEIKLALISSQTTAGKKSISVEVNPQNASGYLILDFGDGAVIEEKIKVKKEYFHTYQRDTEYFISGQIFQENMLVANSFPLLVPVSDKD